VNDPIVQSDCCALSGNYHLEFNPERHDNAPVAAAIGNRGVQLRSTKEVLKLWLEYSCTGKAVLVIAAWYTQLPRLENLPEFFIHRKNHLPVFFVYRAGDYAQRKRISRRSFFGS